MGHQLLAKSSVLVVDKQHAVTEFIDDIQVRPAVVVGIQPGGGESRAVAGPCATLFRDVPKTPMAQVFPELIALIRIAALPRQPGIFFAVTGPGDVEIDKTVAVVIGKGNADGVARQFEIAENGDMLELLALDILINMESEASAQGASAQNDVFPAISIQIGNGDGFRHIV